MQLGGAVRNPIRNHVPNGIREKVRNRNQPRSRYEDSAMISKDKIDELKKKYGIIENVRIEKI